MYTLICAGGSGARVLEAVLQLCAAGLGPDKLRTFLIDPDAANGSVKKTRELVERYNALQKEFGDGPFFKTELDLMVGAADRPELQVWSPVRDTQTFRSVLNYEALNPEQKDILDLFFTEKELAMPMGVGFRGHPALGAAALSLLPLYQNDPDDRFWARLKNDLGHDVTRGEARVIIAGSIFGGTGASTIHPLVRHLRSEAVLETNRDHLHVGAVALVPYFQFNSQESSPTPADPASATAGGARSELFPLASRSAAEYYEHLRSTEDWDFDAMYWIGDDQPAKVGYSVGGPKQDNPAHFVDLLGALACLDFFSNCPQGGNCWYSGPEAIGAGASNQLTWRDLPVRQAVFGHDRAAVKRALHVFHTVAVSHLGFFDPLLHDARLNQSSYYVPWFQDRLMGKEGSLSGRQETEALGRLTAYLQGNYLPWWEQVHRLDGSRVQLFDPGAVAANGQAVPTHRLDSLLYGEQPGRSAGGIDDLFDGMVAVADKVPPKNNLASRYLQMLGDSAARSVQSQEKNAPGA